MQVFITIFDVVWLLLMLALVAYIAVTGRNRTNKLEDAIIESARRSHDQMTILAEANRFLAERNTTLINTALEPTPGSTNNTPTPSAAPEPRVRKKIVREETGAP